MSLSLDHLERRERKRKTSPTPKQTDAGKGPGVRAQPWSKPNSPRLVPAEEGLSNGLNYDLENQWWPTWVPSSLDSWSLQAYQVSEIFKERGQALAQQGLFRWKQIKALSRLPQRIITDIAMGSVRRTFVWQRKKAK